MPNRISLIKLLITNCREQIHVGLEIENHFCTEVECRCHRFEVLSNYQLRFSLFLFLFLQASFVRKHLLISLPVPLFFPDLSMDRRMFLIIEKKIVYTIKTEFLCIEQNTEYHTHTHNNCSFTFVLYMIYTVSFSLFFSKQLNWYIDIRNIHDLTQLCIISTNIWLNIDNISCFPLLLFLSKCWIWQWF